MFKTSTMFKCTIDLPDKFCCAVCSTSWTYKNRPPASPATRKYTSCAKDTGASDSPNHTNNRFTETKTTTVVMFSTNACTGNVLRRTVRMFELFPTVADTENQGVVLQKLILRDYERRMELRVSWIRPEIRSEADPSGQIARVRSQRHYQEEQPAQSVPRCLQNRRDAASWVSYRKREYCTRTQKIRQFSKFNFRTVKTQDFSPCSGYSYYQQNIDDNKNL